MYLIVANQGPLTTVDANPAIVLPHSIENDFDIPLALESRELLPPLYQQNTVRGDQIIQAQRLKLARSIDTVEINVEEVGYGTTILVHQREGWAGDIFFGSCLEGAGNAFDKGRLASPEVAAEQHKLGRSEKLA